MKITLRSVYGKLKEYHFQPGKQMNGTNFPFVKPVKYNSDGSYELVMSESERNSPEAKYFIAEDRDIKIVDGTTFDLDDPLERNIYESIKGSELIVPTRDARDANGDLIIDGNSHRYGAAELYIDIPGEDSRRTVSKRKLITRACTFIENDSVRGRLTKCKLLGKIMNDAPESDVEQFLYDRAEAKPEEIIDLYTGQDTMIKLLIIDAKQKRIIRKERGLFMYGEIMLGPTDDAVLIFLKMPSNKRVYDLIKRDTYPEYAIQYKVEDSILPADVAAEYTMPSEAEDVDVDSTEDVEIPAPPKKGKGK